MNIKRTLVVCALLAGLVQTPAHGSVVLFDNLTQPFSSSWGIDNFGAFGPLAQSFMVGSHAGLDGVTVVVGGATDDAGSFVITLNADNGFNLPGSVLVNLTPTPLLDTNFTAGPAALDLAYGVSDVGHGTILNSGQYWIVISGVGPNTDFQTSALWDAASGAGGVGVLGSRTANWTAQDAFGAYYLSSAPSGDPSFPAMLMSVSVDAPEPMTLAVLGVGLAGIGYARRRRARAV